jgi:hypothetical protein
MTEKDENIEKTSLPASFGVEEDYTSPFACKTLKEIHDACFYKWYQEEFVKGANTIGCTQEWNAYKQCTQVRLFEILKFNSPPHSKESSIGN